MSEIPAFAEIGRALHAHQRFAVLSHMRPDGDAIGSQLALGISLQRLGKTVHFINEDGLPENLAFLPGAELIQQPPAEPLDIDVAIALDTAAKPRLGARSIAAASGAKLWINIDHHLSNPGYGDLNHLDSSSPATGQIIYQLLTTLGLPLPPETRDAIYVAVSTDTGSFQYSGTTAATYAMAADLVGRGLDVGRLNSLTYDNHPLRRVELLRALLNTLELSDDGRVAHWRMSDATRLELNLQPDDSEGLIDTIRSIKGVLVAVFFEELPDGQIRVSTRSKDSSVNVCAICSQFGGGGHALAAGIRMPGPLAQARQAVLAAIQQALPPA
jgi:phosphoesterase RecJ-like protein